jgi:hypothetical protein
MILGVSAVSSQLRETHSSGHKGRAIWLTDKAIRWCLAPLVLPLLVVVTMRCLVNAGVEAEQDASVVREK